MSQSNLGLKLDHSKQYSRSFITTTPLLPTSCASFKSVTGNTPLIETSGNFDTLKCLVSPWFRIQTRSHSMLVLSEKEYTHNISTSHRWLALRSLVQGSASIEFKRAEQLTRNTEFYSTGSNESMLFYQNNTTAYQYLGLVRDQQE